MQRGGSQRVTCPDEAVTGVTLSTLLIFTWLGPNITKHRSVGGRQFVSYNSFKTEFDPLHSSGFLLVAMAALAAYVYLE